MKYLLDTHIVLWAAPGYTELPVTAEHALKVETLPMLHKDPFDRLLLAQAGAEGMLLLTVDASVLQYQESTLAVSQL
jgi:PIN domain nuclease of toxin-antitoxin system